MITVIPHPPPPKENFRQYASQTVCVKCGGNFRFSSCAKQGCGDIH